MKGKALALCAMLLFASCESSSTRRAAAPGQSETPPRASAEPRRPKTPDEKAAKKAAKKAKKAGKVKRSGLGVELGMGHAEPPKPLPDAPSIDFAAGFVAFGDFGAGSSQSSVASAIAGWHKDHRIDAFVTTGDNIYDWGAADPVTAYVDKPYAATRGKRPMWISIGNHDDKGDRPRRLLGHFGLPDHPYEKELPGAQLLFLDSNLPNEAQAKWLDEKLAAPGPPFRIVVFHHPAYACGNHGSTPAVGQFWVPILERHKVALVLNGHDHHYSRFTSAGGVTYVVTGGGGQELYPVRTPCEGVPPRNAAAVRHHFTAVELGADTMVVTAVDTKNEVLDRAVVKRGTAAG